ncbi:PucR family transcriptional regulator [Nonomuraea dietziae]|uniref:PucR family transcriptional regulator n=1 Tax=Nonomuraea dietziae TaxID=65515 RepID=UPI0033D43ADD
MLQRSVDDLAIRLGRPLLLEDRFQRVIAYSEQDGAMDDIRRDSILRRHTTPEVRGFLHAAGILEATEPLRTPGAPALGLLPRVCVPVRHDGALMGFLWFIDAGPAMSAADIDEARASAAALAVALFHESLAEHLASHRELEAVTGVLAGDPGASRALIEAGFPQALAVTALVATPLSAEPSEAARLALEQGMLTVRRRLGGLHLVRYDHATLLTTSSPPAEEVHAAMALPVVVGVGRPRPSLAEADASYAEALHAAQVAARVPGLGRTVEWTRLGVYRMLTHVPRADLHPGLERLLADAQHLPLLETLETYLDLAGSAVATSRRLRLHRTSLYYRLQRVEELAQTDLKDGGERLSLHLSLKLARLSGRYRPRS